MTDQASNLDGLRAKETLGEKVVGFLASDVGTYLLKRAEAEERESLEALATAEADDPKLIRKLQNDVWRANSFAGWLQEAVNDAVSAHLELTSAERLAGDEGGEGGS